MTRRLAPLPPLILFCLLLSARAGRAQDLAADGAPAFDAMVDAKARDARGSSTVGPFCWRRRPDALGDRLEIPLRVCVDRFQLIGGRTETTLVVDGEPIRGTFPMKRVPLLDSYHGWHRVWQADVFLRAKADVDHYQRVEARLELLVALKKNGRPAEPPELDGDLDVEYKLTSGDVSRWSYLVSFAPDASPAP